MLDVSIADGYPGARVGAPIVYGNWFCSGHAGRCQLFTSSTVRSIAARQQRKRMANISKPSKKRTNQQILICFKMRRHGKKMEPFSKRSKVSSAVFVMASVKKRSEKTFSYGLRCLV